MWLGKAVVTGLKDPTIIPPMTNYLKFLKDSGGMAIISVVALSGI